MNSTAQRLYEGIELGERGTTALITYMRTDSVRIADEAKKSAAEYVEARFGKDYMAPGGKGRSFKGKTTAQDAHEAIRPVDVTLTPQDVKEFLSSDQYRLYNLIWCRFVASQMAAATYHDTSVTLTCGPGQWKAKGERLLFPGFLAVMPRTSEEEESALPPLRAAFGIVTLTAGQWGIVFAASLAVIPAAELYKAAARLFRKFRRLPRGAVRVGKQRA